MSNNEKRDQALSFDARLPIDIAGESLVALYGAGASDAVRAGLAEAVANGGFGSRFVLRAFFKSVAEGADLRFLLWHETESYFTTAFLRAVEERTGSNGAQCDAKTKEEVSCEQSPLLAAARRDLPLLQLTKRESFTSDATGARGTRVPQLVRLSACAGLVCVQGLGGEEGQGSRAQALAGGRW